MVRFSCFQAPGHSNKPKKTVQLSVESLQKTLEECSQNQALKDSKSHSRLNLSPLKAEGDAILNSSEDQVNTSLSIERGWKSEEINGKYKIEADGGVNHAALIRKSLSLGSGLDRQGKASEGNYSEDEAEPGYSYDGFHNHNTMEVPGGSENIEISISNQYQNTLPTYSLQVSSDLVNNDSIFSIGDTKQSEKGGHENSDTHYSGEGYVESGLHICDPPVIVKSNSLPDMGSFGGHSALNYVAPRSRSSEGLTALELRWKKEVSHEMGGLMTHDQFRGENILMNEKSNCENLPEDGYDSYNYVSSAKDWIVPVMDDGNPEKNLHEEVSAHQRVELPGKDFKLKRIKDWVNDLQHTSPFEETNDELSNLDYHQVESGAAVMNNLSAMRVDGKVTPGMDAAKKYISSLSANSTTAQLGNHGLVVIPFLSAFVSLRTLNLSGNAIVRITAGALPRGLHSLNLSKNNISTIEGLRDLMRLRVLDLSYNRIVRIGHGLASCSSLKELYFAGNKISEVEGLHRLLKLNVLDLRFNKISTAKCLGQLAANYNSLQAISLEGNPAQKNIGDEQLKKCLQGLLPHLAYYNRQSIKAGTLKDVSDRAARLGFSTDRGLRSDHKNSRKGSHGAAAHRPSPSHSTYHAHRNQAAASLKPTKGRHVRLPPAGSKPTTAHQHNLNDLRAKLLSFKPDLSMRRARSEGTLAAL
ncbi:uncharacterized protein LOC127792153 [Diospyros lotus]|uniref:uncharacterized protein LOC127792153 n=1 Tax=Diospyros lotus TaxID=55363 RepID=UPI00224F0673|nr:uncharacterized protein LOC127792153 [Diospyros lotus]